MLVLKFKRYGLMGEIKRFIDNKRMCREVDSFFYNRTPEVVYVFYNNLSTTAI